MSNDVHQPQCISYSISIFLILLVYLLNLLGAVYILFSFASRHFHFKSQISRGQQGPTQEDHSRHHRLESNRHSSFLLGWNLSSSICLHRCARTTVCAWGKRRQPVSISEASLFHRTAPVFNSLILPTPLGEAPEGVIPALPPRSNSFGPTGASTCVEAALGSLDLHSNFQGSATLYHDYGTLDLIGLLCLFILFFHFLRWIVVSVGSLNWGYNDRWCLARRPLLNRNTTHTSYGSVAQHTADPTKSVVYYDPDLICLRKFKDLTEQLNLTGRQHSAGGFANVHQAIWSREGGSVKVAVKFLRASSGNQEEIALAKKRFCRELFIWSEIKHDNILQLFGIACGLNIGPPGSYGMVCLWAENGDLSDYLSTHVPLSLSKCFKLLTQIANGLHYLHAKSVVHGDLTGNNILLNDKGNVLISDFGLSLVLGDEHNPLYQTTSQPKCNLPWSAPEIFLQPDDASPTRPTTSTDIYSFGSVMLQILSGREPYHGKLFSWIVLYLNRLLKDGKAHPPRPVKAALISDDLWEFMMRCWKVVPQERISVQEVCQFLEQYELSV